MDISAPRKRRVTTNRGWENIRRTNQLRGEGKERRKIREAYYRVMVGSLNDLKRKKLLRSDGSFDWAGIEQAIREEESSNPVGPQ